MRECEKQLEEERKVRDREFKENLDVLEAEFKKVLLENNEKFRQLKVAFEEKHKSEVDAKQLMRVAVLKNTEQEEVINE